MRAPNCPDSPPTPTPDALLPAPSPILHPSHLHENRTLIYASLPPTLNVRLPHGRTRPLSRHAVPAPRSAPQPSPGKFSTRGGVRSTPEPAGEPRSIDRNEATQRL